MTVEEYEKLLLHSRDYYLGAQSKPPRRQKMRVHNKTHKRRNASKDRTANAVVYSSRSYNWR